MGVTMRSVNFAGLVLTGLFLTSCGSSLPPAQQALADGLDAAVAAEPGWSVAAGTSDSFASLATAATSDVVVNLEAGKTYRVLGRCGTGCADLDLRLTNSANEQMATDFGTNNTPQIEHTATATGQYTLTMSMFNCTTGRCDAAVRFISR
jgi:hypothetical protein